MALLGDAQEGEEEEATNVVVGTEREGMLEGENQNERIPKEDGRENSTDGAQNLANTEAAHVPAQVANVATAINEGVL